MIQQMRRLRNPGFTKQIYQHKSLFEFRLLLCYCAISIITPWTWVLEEQSLPQSPFPSTPSHRDFRNKDIWEGGAIPDNHLAWVIIVKMKQYNLMTKYSTGIPFASSVSTDRYWYNKIKHKWGLWCMWKDVKTSWIKELLVKSFPFLL